jgi:hypothetical protein
MLEWIPGKQDADNNDHPLISIKRNDKVIQLTKMLNSIPLDKLSSIETAINNEISK